MYCPSNQIQCPLPFPKPVPYVNREEELEMDLSLSPLNKGKDTKRGCYYVLGRFPAAHGELVESIAAMISTKVHWITPALLRRAQDERRETLDSHFRGDDERCIWCLLLGFWYFLSPLAGEM